jgi:hypothetical protein
MRITRKCWLVRIDRKYGHFPGPVNLAGFTTGQGDFVVPVSVGEADDLQQHMTVKGELTIELKPDRRALEVEIDMIEKRLAEMRALLRAGA